LELGLNFPDKHTVLRVSFWSGVAILFVAPLEVFHLLLGFFHILFEWTEVSLDFVIEFVFDTSLHTTQIVVFYIIIAAILYGFYRLWQGLPDFYNIKKQQLQTLLSDEVDCILVYWHESVINKIKLFIAACGLIFLLII
jgi:hypothetical protein